MNRSEADHDNIFCQLKLSMPISHQILLVKYHPKISLTLYGIGFTTQVYVQFFDALQDKKKVQK